MAVSNDFLEYIMDQLYTWGTVNVRRMFGGAGLFRDGKMFALVADDVVYLKVDGTNIEKYLDAGSQALKPFTSKPAIQSYFEIPPDILEDRDELIKWAEESLSIQKKVK